MGDILINNINPKIIEKLNYERLKMVRNNKSINLDLDTQSYNFDQKEKNSENENFMDIFVKTYDNMIKKSKK